MPELIHNRRVFVIAVLCGVLISATYYISPPLDSPNPYEGDHPLLWPISVIALLNIVPRIFVARLIWEALTLPGWFGEALAFLYWPFLGAFVGARKRWAVWGAVVLAINLGLFALFLYALSQIKLTF